LVTSSSKEEELATLIEAADILVKVCAKVSANEAVLIISDKAQDAQILEALKQAVERVGAKPRVVVYDSLEGGKLPPPYEFAFSNVDVVFACSTEPFPYEYLFDCASKGARVISMFRINTSTLLRTIQVDYEELAEELEEFGRRLEKAKIAEVKTLAGTNLVMELAGRKARLATGLAHNRGDITFIPAGLVAVAPKEFTAKGRLFIDGTIIGAGRVQKPIMCMIQRGRLTDLADDQAYPLLRHRLSKDEDANVLCELAVGTNPKAKTVGGVEDERVRGTISIGFGDNTLLGGKIRSQNHLDVTLLKGTLILDGELVVEAGQILV
jgi:leucyl aminopeptidase (aminopeptidase T)